MDDRSARGIRKKLERAARTFGQDAEDLVQSSLLQMLEGKEPEYRRPDWSIINSYKRSYGDKKTPGRELRKAFNNAGPIDLLNNLAAPEVSPESLSEFKRLLKGLPAFQHGILNLIYVWGFTTAEVARMFGIEHYQAMRIISGALLFIKQREIESAKKGALSEIKERHEVERKKIRAAKGLVRKTTKGDSPHKIEEVSESLSGVFELEPF